MAVWNFSKKGILRSAAGSDKRKLRALRAFTCDELQFRQSIIFTHYSHAVCATSTFLLFSGILPLELE